MEPSKPQTIRCRSLSGDLYTITRQREPGGDEFNYIVTRISGNQIGGGTYMTMPEIVELIGKEPAFDV